jgi:uncharacterized protein (TIGR02996 family)
VARYEHGGRFWTITRVGTVITIISGKVGNRGRSSVKHHATEGAAISAHDQLVIEKQREGYRIAEDSAAATAPVEIPADDDRGAALEAAIVADPDDASAYEVYGDWLQKHGDPRGELIALQQAATTPKTAALVGKHISTHSARFLGKLSELVRDIRIADQPPFIWKHGFIRRAELASMKGRSLVEAVEQLLAHPSAKFLVELALRSDDRAEALAILDAIREHAPPTLRELDLFARANLDRVDGAFPKLETLGITARAFELSNLSAPSLKRAKFRATSISSATVDAIARAPWPVLERLEIRFCSITGACEADFADLRPLLVRSDMPALTHVKLRGCAFAGAVVRALVVAPIARQLQVLDFSYCDFSPADLDVLAKHASNFPNLRELWMPFADLNAQAQKLLEPVAKRVISDAKGPVDTLDYDLAGERVPSGERRFEGTRE